MCLRCNGVLQKENPKTNVSGFENLCTESRMTVKEYLFSGSHACTFNIHTVLSHPDYTVGFGISPNQPP